MHRAVYLPRFMSLVNQFAIRNWSIMFRDLALSTPLTSFRFLSSPLASSHLFSPSLASFHLLSRSPYPLTFFFLSIFYLQFIYFLSHLQPTYDAQSMFIASFLLYISPNIYLMLYFKLTFMYIYIHIYIYIYI